MSSYNLYSLDNGAVYFFSFHKDDELFDPIKVILYIEEIDPHVHYRLTFTKPESGHSLLLALHGSLLSMSNLAIMCFNFANDIDDTTLGISESDNGNK